MKESTARKLASVEPPINFGSPVLEDSILEDKLYWKPILMTTGICTVIVALWLGGAFFITKAVASSLDRQSQSVGSEIKTLGTALGSSLTSIETAINEKHDVDALYFKILALRPNLDYTFAHRLATLVYRESRAQAMDPNFIIALIRTESNFNPNARSVTGAHGLTQIMGFWKQALDIKGELSDPEVSIHYGVQIFKTYEKMFNGNTFLALAAYNQGPETVNATLRRGEDPRETNDYTANIQKFYTKLKWLDRGREGIADP